jgi:predicted PurR-regulated permease PerM
MDSSPSFLTFTIFSILIVLGVWLINQMTISKYKNKIELSIIKLNKHTNDLYKKAQHNANNIRLMKDHIDRNSVGIKNNLNNISDNLTISTTGDELLLNEIQKL